MYFIGNADLSEQEANVATTKAAYDAMKPDWDLADDLKSNRTMHAKGKLRLPAYEKEKANDYSRLSRVCKTV